MIPPPSPTVSGPRGRESIAGWLALALLGTVMAFVPNEQFPLGIDDTFLGLAAIVAAAVLPFVDWRAGMHGWWLYGGFLAFVAVRAGFAGARDAWLETSRQLAFVAVTLSVAAICVTARARRAVIAAMLVAIGVILPQVLGPGLGEAGYGRRLFYLALDQWGGYPEIGMLACVGVGLGAGLALTRGVAPAIRLASVALAVVFVTAATYIYSRSAVAASLLTVLWLVVVRFGGPRARVAVAALSGVAGLALFAAAFVPSLPSAGLEFTMRAEGWRTAARMLAAHPIFGVGPGLYMASYPAFSSAGDPVHAYNLVLHVASELGVAGVALYLLLWRRVLSASLRAATSPDTHDATALAVHGALVAFFVRSMSEHFLANIGSSFRMLLLLALLFGLAEGLRTIGRR